MWNWTVKYHECKPLTLLSKPWSLALNSTSTSYKAAQRFSTMIQFFQQWSNIAISVTACQHMQSKTGWSSMVLFSPTLELFDQGIRLIAKKKGALPMPMMCVLLWRFLTCTCTQRVLVIHSVTMLAWCMHLVTMWFTRRSCPTMPMTSHHWDYTLTHTLPTFIFL